MESKPKRPANVFFKYRSANDSKVRARNPDIDSKMALKILSAKYKDASEKELKPLQDAYDAEMAVFNKEFDAWEAKYEPEKYAKKNEARQPKEKRSKSKEAAEEKPKKGKSKKSNNSAKKDDKEKPKSKGRDKSKGRSASKAK